MAGLDAEQERTTRRHGRGANRRLLGLLLIGLGTVWFLEEAHLLALSAETLLSGLLILLGAGLLFTARRGRGMWPIGLGVVLTLALVLNSTSLEFPSLPGIGDQTYRPQSASDVLRTYNGGIGNVTIDLSALAPQDLDRAIAVHLGIGDVKVLLRADTYVVVVSHFGMGQLTACGQQVPRGVGDKRYDNAPPAGSPRLRLEVDGGIGNVEVSGCSPAGSRP